MSTGSIYAISRYRRGKDEVLGTNDDRFFENLNLVTKKLEETVGLSTMDKQSLQDFIDSGQFNLRTIRFRVDVTARVKYRRESLRSSCVVSQLGKVFSCESEFFNADQSEVRELNANVSS